MIVVILEKHTRAFGLSNNTSIGYGIVYLYMEGTRDCKNMQKMKNHSTDIDYTKEQKWPMTEV